MTRVMLLLYALWRLVFLAVAAVGYVIGYSIGVVIGALVAGYVAGRK